MAEARSQDLENAVPPGPARREIWVGLFAIVGVVAALVTLITLTDPGTFRGRANVYAVLPDAGGLRNGDPVRMLGVNIGRVTEFDLADGGGVRIRLELERQYHVPADSRMRLRSAGLVGGMVAEIEPGTSSQPLEGGETIPGTIVRGLFDPGSDGIARVDTLLLRAEGFVSPRVVDDLTESVSELRSLITETRTLVSAQREDLTALSGALRVSAQNLERATSGPELRRAVVRLDSVSAQLALASANVTATTASMEEVLGRIERGEGTLGLLSADDSLYLSLTAAATGLQAATESLNVLLEDVRANPRKYINLEIF
ncbi:MAG TPA: MlaD family protein [Longimicrobiales bacterium]|nr:MlaD family protein [Longimicrobiales bacterium]